MKALKFGWLPCLSLAAGLMASTSAHAVWTFQTTGTSTLANCTTDGSGNASSGAANTCVAGTAKVDNTTVSLTGFAVDNNTAATSINSVSYRTSNAGFASSTTKWSTAALNSYAGGGQGINGDGSGTAPNHAVDNNGKTEAVLLSFSSSIALSSVGLGYTASAYCSRDSGTSTSLPATVFPSTSDACPSGYTKRTTQTDGTSGVDISLFRWVGNGTPTDAAALTNTAAATMTGWQLVGNYGDLTQDKTNPYSSVNTTGLTSSYWLISAYNSGFTQTSGITQNRGNLTNGDDYFKLFAAAGTVCATNLTNGQCGGSSARVPEPATLALTGVALLGVAGLRRRRDGKTIA
jgi:hypothetical protein